MNRSSDNPETTNSHNAAITVVGDGGASGSRYAIFDANSRRIAQTQGKPASLSLGAAAACDAICEAISALGEQTYNNPHWLPDSLMLGLAGAEQLKQKQHFISLLPEMLKCRIVTDGYAHLNGVTAGGPGICLSLGTGSVIHWHDGKNRQGMSGGWGFPVGDEASGAWLGRALVNAWLWSIDSDQATASNVAGHAGSDFQPYPSPGRQLTTSLENRIGNNRSDIQHWTINAVSTDYASLVDLLLEAINNDDPCAMTLHTRGAEQCLRLLALCPSDLPVYVTGGLAPFYESNLQKHLGSRLKKAKGDALDGLHLLAISQPF